MKIFERSIFFDTPKRIVPPFSWAGHIPFAFFLIEQLRPTLLVELGVHTGNSYNAFCQAVKTLNTQTTCYGVDTWQGDEHAGFYPENIYADLFAYQQQEYHEFSQLMRMTFDEALEYFADHTIDLLHIDGCHRYSDVRYDFECWLPKVSDTGVVLFHDTQVRRDEFGVWRLWQELSAQYPSCEFRHGYGLGVLAVGKQVGHTFLDLLQEFSAKPCYQNLFSRFGETVTLAAEKTELINALHQKEEHLNQLTPHYIAQLFIDTGLGFNAMQAITIALQGQEREIEFDLAAYRDLTALRFDPLNDVTVLHLHGMQIVTADGNALPIDGYQTNACYQNGNHLLFDTPDPSITFTAPVEQAQKLVITLEYLALGHAAYPHLLARKAQQLSRQAAELAQKEAEIAQFTPHYIAQVFLDTGLGFNETQAIAMPVQGQEREIEFDLAAYHDLNTLRFDPLNDVTVLNLHGMQLVTAEGEVLPIEAYQTNACYQEGHHLLFDTSDPNIIFAAPVEHAQKLIIALEYLALGHAAYPHLLARKAQQLSRQAVELAQKDQQIGQKEAEIFQLTPHYIAQVFLDTGLGFNETQVIAMPVHGQERKIEFDLSTYGDVRALRFDPLNDATVLHLHGIQLVTAERELLPIHAYQTNACYQHDDHLLFDTPDPSLTFAMPVGHAQKLVITLEYIALGPATYPYILQEKNQQLIEQAQTLQAKDAELAQQAQTLQAKDAELAQQAQTLQAKDVELAQQSQALQIKEAEHSHTTQIIEQMEETFSWKLTTPLRAFRNLRFFPHQWSYQDASWKGKLLRFCAKTLWPKRLIRQSGLFDQDYYLANNPDVAMAKVNPLRHFLRHGGQEGRNPHPLFEAAYYLDYYPDINQTQVNPLLHYLLYGQFEGRQPNRFFDAGYYVTQYPDVKASGLEPLRHYLLYGGFEGRKPSPFFDSAGYLENNPDVKAAGLNPLVHYLLHGENEGRLTSRSRAHGDPYQLWIAQNPDFDPSYYLEQNPDVKQSGVNPLAHYVLHGKHEGRVSSKSNDPYRLWIKHNEPTPAELEQQRLTTFAYQPKISIITPTYNTPKQFLIEMIESVLNQTYVHWELCLADGSTDPVVREMLAEYAQRDLRIKLRYLSENQGIAGNSNEAIALATGDFITLLDHDDTLMPFALFELVKTINAYPHADFLYSDEDKLSENGQRCKPFFKPDWSPDKLRGHNYPIHLSVIQKDLLQKVGNFRSGFEGSQDYDLILRLTEQAQQIVHIPQILYHWRIHPQSTAGYSSAKLYAYVSAKKALTEHLQRIGQPGIVEDTPYPGQYQIKYLLPQTPLISILIPNRDHADDLKRCVQSIIEKSTYRNFEIIIIENGSCEPETFTLYDALKESGEGQVLTWDQPFHFSMVNNFAANFAHGEFLLFLNNDTEVITPDWLERLLEHAIRKEIGAVGAKLLYPDQTIQHAGVIVGLAGSAAHPYQHFSRNDPGYYGRLIVVHNVSAVTGACLMVRKALFHRVGGFDERFELALNDVDFCLKLLDIGYLNLWTPHAELYHYESKTRGYEDEPEKQQRFAREVEIFRQKWQDFLERGDPYYSPHLSLVRGDYAIHPAKTQRKFPIIAMVEKSSL